MSCEQIKIDRQTDRQIHVLDTRLIEGCTLLENEDEDI